MANIISSRQWKREPVSKYSSYEIGEVFREPARIQQVVSPGGEETVKALRPW